MLVKIKNLLLKESSRPWIIYGGVALAIMLPLLKPGFILTLDMIFGPKIRMPETISNLYVFEVLLRVLSFIISVPSIEKMILLSIFILSGVGMYYLCEVKNKYGRYFAGIIYMINPFTYSRMMDGHFVLLLGYALMPFFVKTLWNFMHEPDLKKSLSVGIWASAIAMLSVHLIFFMALLFLISAILFSLQNRKSKSYFKSIIKYSLATFFLFTLVNIFWLLPILKKTDATYTFVNNFDRKHYIAFQTTADPKFGVLFNTAAMYGHWGDRENRYVLPKTVVPFWYVIAGAFIAFALTGLIIGIKKRKIEIIILGITGFLGWLLAVGVAYGPFSGAFYWLVDHVPMFQGFRDSQKFAGLLILAYAYLGGYAVSHITDKTKDSKLLWFLPELLLILPLIYTPNIFWGFNGQLKPVQYPQDWYELNDQLNRDKEEFKVLFLPWHQYMSFNFTGRVIANPAKIFFDKAVLQGDVIELGDIYRQEATPETLLIEKRVLHRRNVITDVGRELNSLHIKYIIVAKEVDYKNYNFLDRQTDLQLISDTENLKVYVNKSFKL